MTRLRELKVVLDTNVIYNISGGEFLKDDVGKLIEASSSHADLLITWYLPEVVRNEREHQLRQLARKSIPAIQNFERVVELDFGITDKIIVDRVHDRIDRQIAHFNLQILTVDPSKVDWAKMMSSAAFREPPFSAGEHEKGFRDALIVEAIDQLLAYAGPSRIAAVMVDELLSKTIIAKTTGVRNVHVLPSIEELKGLINTLVSNVDESFIQKMNAAAAIFFFDRRTREGFIYSHKIKEMILKKFDSLIYAVPTGTNEVKRGKALVSPPRFKEKIGDRIYWVTRIAFRMEAFGDNSPTSYVISSGYSGYSEFAGYSTITDEPESDIEMAPETVATLPPKPVFALQRAPSLKGSVKFEVTWSVAVTTKHMLADPIVESVDYIETTWE